MLWIVLSCTGPHFLLSLIVNVDLRGPLFWRGSHYVIHIRRVLTLQDWKPWNQTSLGNNTSNCMWTHITWVDAVEDPYVDGLLNMIRLGHTCWWASQHDQAWSHHSWRCHRIIDFVNKSNYLREMLIYILVYCNHCCHKVLSLCLSPQLTAIFWLVWKVCVEILWSTA